MNELEHAHHIDVTAQLTSLHFHTLHCFLLVSVAPSRGLQSAEQFSGVPQHRADGGEVHGGGQDQGGQYS